MADEKKDPKAPQLTHANVKIAIANLGRLLEDVKVRDYASSTRDTGGVNHANPKDEGYDMAHSGMVAIKNITDTEIEFGITSRQGREHLIMVSLKDGDPWMRKIIADGKGTMNTVNVDLKKPLENVSKLEFAVEGFLKHNAMELIETGGDNSISRRLLDLLLIHPTLMLHGWVGCGKTWNLLRLFEKLNAGPYGSWTRYMFTGTEGAKEDDLLATFLPRPDGPGFMTVPGVIAKAFKDASQGKKVFLYVNEINRFNPKVQSLFVQALDHLEFPDFQGYRLYNHLTQEEYLAPTTLFPEDPKKGCIKVVSSINIGDQGTYQMSAALKRRFLATYQMYYLPPEQEAILIHERSGKALSIKVCKGMVAVANSVREAYRQMKVAAPLDTGSLIAWAVTVAGRIAPTPEIIMECACYTWLYKCVMYEANGVPAEESEKSLKDIVSAKLGAPAKV